MIFASTFSAPPTRAATELPSRAHQPISVLNDLALASEQLLRGQKIVCILHNGNLYKLQATKLGKLILTK